MGITVQESMEEYHLCEDSDENIACIFRSIFAELFFKFLLVVDPAATAELHDNAPATRFHHIGSRHIQTRILLKIVPGPLQIDYFRLEIKFFDDAHSEMVVEFSEVYAFVVIILGDSMAQINQYFKNN